MDAGALASGSSCQPKLTASLKPSRCSAAWCISFFGMQPTLTHVPPKPLGAMPILIPNQKLVYTVIIAVKSCKSPVSVIRLDTYSIYSFYATAHPIWCPEEWEPRSRRPPPLRRDVRLPKRIRVRAQWIDQSTPFDSIPTNSNNSHQSFPSN